MQNSILIVSFKLLGDIIVQTPAIKSIKLTYPQAKISVLLDERFQDVLVGNPYVDGIITYPITKYKKANALKKIVLVFSFLFKLKKQNFQKVLLMDKTSLGALIAFFCGAKIRIGLKHQTFSFLLNKKIEQREGTMDYIDFYNLFPRALDVIIQDRKTELFVNPGTLSEINQIVKKKFGDNKRIISIHLGVSREDKRWPLEKWAKYISEMAVNYPHIGFIVICGPGEIRLIKDLINYLDPNTKEQLLNAGELYIKELVCYFSLSHLILCHDSASRHVAAALGKCTISLMNDWNLTNWKLYSEKEKQYVITPENEVNNVYNISSIAYESLMNKSIEIISQI